MIGNVTMRKSNTKLNARQVLAENLKRLREARGMTQEDLALESGISRTYLSDVELGKRNIGIDNLERLAQALRVKVADLLIEEK
jgi:transcriptional regulator with XRE-family HTH domain